MILYLLSPEKAYLNGMLTKEKQVQSGRPSIWHGRGILSGSKKKASDLHAPDEDCLLGQSRWCRYHSGGLRQVSPV